MSLKNAQMGSTRSWRHFHSFGKYAGFLKKKKILYSNFYLFPTLSLLQKEMITEANVPGSNTNRAIIKI